jgi:hypothetical protein
MSTAPIDEPPREDEAAPLRLRLYVCGNAPNSVAAVRNLRALQESRLAGPLLVEVIDVAVERGRAVQDRIVITPTLVLADAPHVRVLGNLSDTARVLAALAAS